MDRDQILYKLKSAIEDNKIQAFEQECNEEIIKIDNQIKVRYVETLSLLQKLCKNNYTQFLQSLSTVVEVQAEVKELRKVVVEMQQTVTQVEND